MPKTIVVVAAGGVGRRFGAPLPKQFCRLGEESVVGMACRRFAEALPGAQIVVVADKAWAHCLPADAIIAQPGETRWQSVSNALRASARIDADIVLVHDGARPLVPAAVIDRVVRACELHQGAIPVVAVTDSLRRADGSPANRADFRAVQTPQGFRADLLRKAYELPERPEFTDDASVMSAAGFGDIAMVDGDVCNLKITHPIDLKIAELYLEDGRLDRH